MSSGVKTVFVTRQHLLTIAVLITNSSMGGRKLDSAVCLHASCVPTISSFFLAICVRYPCKSSLQRFECLHPVHALFCICSLLEILMLLAEAVLHSKAYSRIWSYRLFPRRMLQVSDHYPHTQRRLRRVYITPEGPPSRPLPAGFITAAHSVEPRSNLREVFSL